MNMLKFELSEEDTTLLINILNHPSSAQSIHLAGFINLFQQQAAPQLAEQEINKNADGVPTDLEEKN